MASYPALQRSTKPDWLTVFTTDEYFLVVGPTDFVELVVGSPIEETLAQFQRNAEDVNWPAACRRD
jgi:hypothetical protein